MIQRSFEHYKIVVIAFKNPSLLLTKRFFIELKIYHLVRKTRPLYDEKEIEGIQ